MIALPMAVVAFMHLNANDRPAALFPAKHPYNEAIQALLDYKGWSSSVSVVMNSPNSVSLDAVAESLKNDPVLHGNVVDYETASKTRAWLDRNHLLPEETLTSTFGMSLAYKQLVDENGIARANLYLRDISVSDLQLLKSEISRVCGSSCHPAGYLIAYSDFCSEVPKTLLDSISMSLLLVALIIGFVAAAFGKLRFLPALLASSFLGPMLDDYGPGGSAHPDGFLKMHFRERARWLDGR